MRPLLLLAALMAASPLAAQSDGGFGALTLADSTTALLGGHLLVRLPESAVVAARPHSLMGAAEPDESETRAVIDQGQWRFVMLAQELNRTAPEALVDSTALAFESYREVYRSVTIEELPPPAPGLRAVLVKPDLVEVTREAIPVRWVVIASPDGTVQELSFYINQPAARANQLVSADTLAAAITSSLRPGPRQVRHEARTVVITTDGPQRLVLPLPAGLTYARQDGPDFVVHRIEPLLPLGAESTGGFGVYDGHHPSAPGPGTDSTAAVVLGGPVQWQLREEHDESSVTYRADLLLPNPLLPGGYLHLFVWGTTPQERDRLLAVAGALQTER